MLNEKKSRPLTPVAQARRAYLQAKQQAAFETKERNKQRQKALTSEMKVLGKKQVRRWVTDEEIECIDAMLSMSSEERQKILNWYRQRQS